MTSTSKHNRCIAHGFTLHFAGELVHHINKSKMGFNKMNERGSFHRHVSV